MNREIEKAEQQILGFYHCYNGYDFRELITSMGLTKAEYKIMVKKGMLDYLPQELGNELLEIINSNTQ